MKSDKTLAEGEGRYANSLEVGHNEFEFLLEFGQEHEEFLETVSHTRIVTVPFFAKQFARVLMRAVSDYEAAFGPIDDTDEDECTGLAALPNTLMQ